MYLLIKSIKPHNLAHLIIAIIIDIKILLHYIQHYQIMRIFLMCINKTDLSKKSIFVFLITTATCFKSFDDLKGEKGHLYYNSQYAKRLKTTLK